MGPDVATDALIDADIKRNMIRSAALYVIQKCKDLDAKKEQEIKARGDDKEIEAWFNEPRYHDQRVLLEAKELVEEQFLKPVRDEQKRRKYYQIFKIIFRDLNTFKRELRALSKMKSFKTSEIRQLYVPNTVSMESYMYALDKFATVDHAVSDMTGANSQLNSRIQLERNGFKKREIEHDKKIEEYVVRVKQMVKDTGIVVEIDDPTEKAEFEK